MEAKAWFQAPDVARASPILCPTPKSWFGSDLQPPRPRNQIADSTQSHRKRSDVLEFGVLILAKKTRTLLYSQHNTMTQIRAVKVEQWLLHQFMRIARPMKRLAPRLVWIHLHLHNDVRLRRWPCLEKQDKSLLQLGAYYRFFSLAKILGFLGWKRTYFPWGRWADSNDGFMISRKVFFFCQHYFLLTKSFTTAAGKGAFFLLG